MKKNPEQTNQHLLDIGELEKKKKGDESQLSEVNGVRLQGSYENPKKRWGGGGGDLLKYYSIEEFRASFKGDTNVWYTVGSGVPRGGEGGGAMSRCKKEGRETSSEAIMKRTSGTAEWCEKRTEVARAHEGRKSKKKKDVQKREEKRTPVNEKLG